LLDELYLQFLFTRVSFSLNDAVLQSADVNEFCFMRINCTFVAMVGLMNGEPCLIHNRAACGEINTGVRKEL